MLSLQNFKVKIQMTMGTSSVKPKVDFEHAFLQRAINGLGSSSDNHLLKDKNIS